MSIIDEWLILCKAQVEGSGFQKLNKQITSTKNNLFDAKNLFRAFIGYDVYSGIKQFATSLVQSTRDLGAMTSRFYAITKSEKLANEELQWTFDLAQRTAMGLKATADSYSIFYSATQKGLGTEGARQVFQDWTEVSRVLHLSEYQFERVTYALREMASKGAIYSQDLRMQIGTHVPNAIGLAQKAVNELGISGNDWFEKFQKQAKGNQQLINQFIVLFSKYAKQAYASPEALAKSLEQPDAQIQRLYNTWQKFTYSLAGGQFQKDLVSFLKFTNILLEKITKHSDIIYKVIKSLVVLFGIFLGGKAIAGLIQGFKFISGFIGLLNSIGGLKGLYATLSLFGKLPTLMSGSGILMRLIPFLMNPYTLGAILIIACIPLLNWFLKKFFPNVWIAVYSILNDIELFFMNLWARISNIPWVKTLEKILGRDEISNAIKQEKQNIKTQGGFWKDGGLDKEAVGKWGLLRGAEILNNPIMRRLASNLAIPALAVGATGSAIKHTIDITVNNKNVANNIQSEDIKQAMQDNQQSIWNRILGGVKPNK